MKFMQIASALDSIPELRKPPTTQQRKPRPVRLETKKERDRVEGDPTRKPIDRTAAMVIARASWIHKPPQNPTIMQNPITGETLYSAGSTTQIAEKMAKTKSGAIVEALNTSVAASSEAIDSFHRKMHSALADLEVLTQKHAQAMRALRMSAVSDAGQITKVLGDIRALFIGPDHTKEMERLEHFIALCERLQTLKRNGTLDAVADTILKLSQ